MQLLQNSNLNLFGPTPLISIIKSEWKWAALGAILSFFLANAIISGGSHILLPELSYPYSYGGDGWFASWQIQRLIEGWIYENPRSGYPFGSNFLDYPVPDIGSMLILKILGAITGNYYATLNLFFLISFPVIFITSYFVLRSIGLNVWFTCTAAALFTFLPFHFQRFVHIYYTWYFVVPIFYYATFVIFFRNENNVVLDNNFKKLLSFLLFLFIGSFGVYYALFGMIVLSVGAVASWVYHRNFYQTVKLVIIPLAGVMLSVLLCVSPNLLHKISHTSNNTAVSRELAHSEIFGLKLTQLVLPRQEHRVPILEKLRANYDQKFPLINENSFASLGFFGSLGFILLGMFIILNLSGRKIDPRIALLSMIVYVLFIFGTVGGLGTLFSILFKYIRGWNRISIFIGFGALAAFFLILQTMLTSRFSGLKLKRILVLTSIFILVVGLGDVTAPVSQDVMTYYKNTFDSDRKFIQQIENFLPQNSAVYQLPYMSFPEVPPKHKLSDYGLASGFLHSSSLHWNYGGMKNREGDLFYHCLSQEPLEKQLEIIKKLGFGGIYIDRRGFEDDGATLIQELTTLLKSGPNITSDNGQLVFFAIKSDENTQLLGLDGNQIMQHVGYVADKYGPRYKANLAEGIDFARPNLPEFVQSINGLSDPENWGRWSDANISPSVYIEFDQPLPKNFILVLLAQPFGPNENQKLTIKVGSKIHQIILGPGQTEIRVPTNLGNEEVRSIEFIPPFPTAPSNLGINTDTRRIGIGLINLRFESPADTSQNTKS